MLHVFAKLEVGKAVPVWSNLMQPGATIQKPQLMLDGSNGFVLLITQCPVCCVVNVALQQT
jgi:hypothetical protein